MFFRINIVIMLIIHAFCDCVKLNVAYLPFEVGTDHKHEYRRGTVYAMSGASVHHGIITVNMSTRLNVQLGEQAYSVSSPDTRVHITRVLC